MKIVIQCAGSKQTDAGSLHDSNGKPVMFVANPDEAPFSNAYSYSRPDDISDDGINTWREKLLEYAKSGTNPYNILPAYQLYKNIAYEELVERFGVRNIYILSAGWGLIPASFLTPTYNLTFNIHKDKKHITRSKRANYQDFNMLSDDGEEIIFLGGKAYLPLFRKLTEGYKGKKIVFFNSANKPNLPEGFELRKYETKKRTNWHYECAKSLIDGSVEF